MRVETGPILTPQALSLLEDDLRAVFAFEATELLHRAEQALQLLIATPQAAAPALDKLRRRLHTLKGAASAAGETELRDTVHALEARLFPAQNQASDELLSTLRDGLSTLRRMLGRPPADEAGGLESLPRNSLLHGLHSTVAAAARECGKEVRLTVNVDERADRSGLLGRLHEPLLHLLRNAVAHGIEAPARRRDAGKRAAGTVLVQAVCADRRCTVRVIDDGDGLDLEAVAARAAQRGLHDSTVPLKPEQALSLLCQAGFSTRERTDELAGRGIGLDVVKSALSDLRGTLQLHSVKGAGCAFTLEIPLPDQAGEGA